MDKLMKVRSLNDQEAEYIKELYKTKIMQLEQVIFNTAKVLSEITNYTSVALAPQLSKVTIRHIQLVPIDKEFALLVVVTSSGILKDTVIRVPDGIDGDFLNKVSNILNDNTEAKLFRNRSEGSFENQGSICKESEIFQFTGGCADPQSESCSG